MAGAVVAIDGPAGSGKSTLARLLADRLGFLFLDSGAMYRALTWKALRQGVDPADGDATAALLRGTEIRLQPATPRARTLLDGRDVSTEIRGPEVTAAVSRVAAHPGVRAGMVDRQRAFVREGGGRGVVVEGRDIGTVVFPDAAVKFFLDATPAERARRRAAETGGTADAELHAMKRRDAADEGRAVAPLRAAADAERVDTTGLTVEQVLDALLDRVRRRLGGS
ncbi:MAG TPA: (d)CMP kinase [Planctomycetota bacterium]|nr:(d)CMP kinase [Planctomycetota bacterium]